MDLCLFYKFRRIGRHQGNCLKPYNLNKTLIKLGKSLGVKAELENCALKEPNMLAKCSCFGTFV